MAKVKLQVTNNATVNVEGRIYRAGESFELERDDTAAQLLSAGTVTEVKPRRKSSGSKTSGRRLTSRGKR